VNQASDERLDVIGHDPTLPVCELNAAEVFPPLAVLRDEARPVLPVVRDLDDSCVATPQHVRSSLARYRFDGGSAFGDDAGVDGIERDPQTPDSAGTSRDAPVAQVHPE
jgi:hypothetical protein